MEITGRRAKSGWREIETRIKTPVQKQPLFSVLGGTRFFISFNSSAAELTLNNLANYYTNELHPHAKYSSIALSLTNKSAFLDYKCINL
jgi:hypothetical protein